MSDMSLRSIDTSKARDQLREPDFAGDKPVNGLDTETKDGDIFAIGMFTGGGDYRERYDLDGVGGPEILEFLTQGCMRGAHNVWFNLHFDANVVLKGLPMKNLQELQFRNTTEYTDANEKTWEITYIPKKMLKIQTDNQEYCHYDAAQFSYVRGGLEKAADTWLDESKADDGLDVEQFSDRSYLEANEDAIRTYLKEDCRLTRNLFQKIVRLGESLDIPFGKPYSTGYVAADYVRNQLEYKPGYASAQMQEAAWQTYRGGRFEVAKRGHVGQVYGADINSAYPAVLSNLPDPHTLQWENGGEDVRNDYDHELFETADYGFVDATVTTDENRPFQPFAVANPEEGGRVEYPALEDCRKWFLLPTLRFALEHGFVEDIEFHGIHAGFETEETEYPFSFFEGLYDDRKTLEKEKGEDEKGTLLKIVMNSIYGKTCQTNTNYEEIEEGIEMRVEETGFNPEADWPKVENPYDDDDESWYFEKPTAGSLFNPFLATYITGETRLQLLRSVVENDLEDDTVMMATDCIMVEAEAFEGSDLHERAEADTDSYAEALGGWDYDYVGEAFVVGSGIYEVYTGDDEDAYASGCDIDTDELKKGARGFKDLHSDDNDYQGLIQAANRFDTEIPVETTRPISYAEVVFRGDDLSEVGKFDSSKRGLQANMDDKRRWNTEDCTFNDLLSGIEGSDPKQMESEDLRYRGDRL